MTKFKPGDRVDVMNFGRGTVTTFATRGDPDNYDVKLDKAFQGSDEVLTHASMMKPVSIVELVGEIQP